MNQRDWLLNKVLGHPWFEKFLKNQVSGSINANFVERLEKYQISKYLRKLTQLYFSVHIPDCLTDAKEIFYELDKDNDGFITMSELKEGINLMYPDIDIGNLLYHKLNRSWVLIPINRSW